MDPTVFFSVKLTLYSNGNTAWAYRVWVSNDYRFIKAFVNSSNPNNYSQKNCGYTFIVYCAYAYADVSIPVLFATPRKNDVIVSFAHKIKATLPLSAMVD